VHGGGARVAGTAAPGGPERHGGDRARPALRARHPGRDQPAPRARAGAEARHPHRAQPLHCVHAVQAPGLPHRSGHHCGVSSLL